MNLRLSIIALLLTAAPGSAADAPLQAVSGTATASLGLAELPWQAGLKSGLWVALILLAALTLYAVLRKGSRSLSQRVEARRGRWPDLKLRGLTLISKHRITNAALSAVMVVERVLMLVLGYFALTGIFGLFEPTREFSRNLLSLVVDPVAQAVAAGVAFIPDLLHLLIGVVLIYYVGRFVRFLFHHIHAGNIDIPGFEREWAMPTSKIVRFLITVMGIIVLAPYLPGSKSPAFQGVSLFLGLIVSLSSSSAIANLIAGTILIYTSAFRDGDRVKIGDTVGVITERTLLVTRIRTPKNVVVTVPNALVLSGKIENESVVGASRRILNTSVTIGYDVAWPQVHELLLGAAAGVDGALAEPAPFVLQTRLDDFYVAYELNFSTDRPESQEKVLSIVHARIQERFAAAKVEILSPHYRALRRGPTALPQGPEESA